MVNERRFAIEAAVRFREDFDAASLRGLAKASRDPNQLRRLLSLAEIYDGGSPGESARIGGAGPQTARDWGLRFNGDGPEASRPRPQAERRPTPGVGYPNALSSGPRRVCVAVMASTAAARVLGAGKDLSRIPVSPHIPIKPRAGAYSPARYRTRRTTPLHFLGRS